MPAKLFVFAGPSGVGKSFLMHMLPQRHPNQFTVPKLLTTRRPRANETAVDREFITEAQFEKLVKADEFAWTDSFYGNRYGYTHEMLEPRRQHILINALPPMVELFATFPDIVMLGLSVAPGKFELVRKRLEARGDPPEAISTRLDALKNDVKIMADQRALIEKHGKFFEIEDDSTAATVINWIEYNYL